ncbi:type VI secretion system ImpA family N-terminal domain-containing protein [Moritella sp. 5]|uniref:type VI secretion system protein TssA n=1 Tax=Moritella sp. 5 TaxID=2746231 RepID=UPI001BA58029|nr:type VI secretion system ImpA family N-terminal domain-containing protein [Moritella sp. 5]QUM79865.1 type VI secretion system ImpA family N-terminal domain-containing protein [Moritella sp. 5]
MLFNQTLHESLLLPIDGDQFCGVYLKSDKQKFRPLRNEFNVAQTSLRQLMQTPDPAEMDSLQDASIEHWHSLSSSLIEIFKTTSKDIELAGWMLAAQIVIDPALNGLREVSQWLQALVEGHWDEVHPILPDNKIKSESDKLKEINAFKVKGFVQLVGESEDSSLVYSPFLMLPLIGDLNYSRYLSEERKGGLPELRQQYQNVAMGERAKVTSLMQNLVLIRDAMRAVEAHVANVCKQHLLPQPGFKFVVGLITKILNAMEYVSGLKSKDTQVTKAEGQPATNESSHVDGGEKNMQVKEDSITDHALLDGLPVNNQEFNRDDAFHQLRTLAEFFRKVEPHSPVSYLLEKAIRWGYLSLPELMSELLLNQEDTIKQVFHLSALDENGDTNVIQPTHKKMLPLSDVGESMSVQHNNTRAVSTTTSHSVLNNVTAVSVEKTQEKPVSTSSSNSLW